MRLLLKRSKYIELSGNNIFFNTLNIRRYHLSNAVCSNLDHKKSYKEQHLRQDVDSNRLRNIGIVAHINAGKTTTTERILYHAGSTSIVGDVDKGNTVTDYLIQERDRGITITSAAVSLDWHKHRINLIDTPGHVDFTFEVERSLSVIDGAITLLDASAGVEAQTITVWNQAKRYRLPNIIFLNKYDKPLADYKMCMSDLRKALNIKTSLIQIPIKTKEKKRFSSIVDVIHRQCYSWLEPDNDHGNKFISEPAIESSVINKEHVELMDQIREELVNKLSDIDDKFASHVLECDKICDVSGKLINESLRRATINCQLSPVLVGSSFKYIGVQQLMNAIVDYLPSPHDREKQVVDLLSLQYGDESLKTKINSSSSGTSAFIFKIMHDKRQGCLSYVKVLNGSLSQLQKFKNIQNSKLEQAKKVYRVFGDELREIDKPVRKHDIVVLTGLNESKTSDILVDLNYSAVEQINLDEENNEFKNKELEQNEEKNNYYYYDEKPLPFKLMKLNSNLDIIVPEIKLIEPVYFCSIESKSIAQQLKLEHALSCLAKEDPSFTYEIDQLGVTTIRGMGKLHLDITRDRIETEYNIQPILGPLQISYRETIEGCATEELQIDRLVNSVKNKLTIKLCVKSKPKAGLWRSKMLRLDMSGESNLGKLRHDHRKAIELGIKSALDHGPSMGFTVIDCDILLIDFQANRRCSLPIISSTTSQCVMNALQRCSPVLLEPIMLLEVVTPNEFNGIISSDLLARRGLIQSTTARHNGSMVIRAETPLSTLSDYSEFLRINTSGRASFSMELHSYLAMSELGKQNIVRV